MNQRSDEIWQNIPGFDGYQASNAGKLRSVDRVVEHKNGTRQLLRGRDIKPRVNSMGYLQAKISKRYVLVHRMVLLAFKGAPLPGFEAAHGDGVRTNCALSNLDWKTHRENIFDKVAHGTAQAGERHAMAKLSAGDVASIRAGAKTKNLRFLADLHRISVAQVSKIVAGDAWADEGYVPPPRRVRAKITQEIADLIRKDCLTEAQGVVGERFGICASNVSRIVNGKAWR